MSPKTLTPAQEAALWRKCKAGDTAARDALIQQYSYLCYVTAKRYKTAAMGNFTLSDLVGEGNCGLIHAVDTFDTSRNFRFTTYAIAHIRGAILDAMRQYDWVPRTVRESDKKIYQARETLSRQLGREPTDAETASALAMPLKEYERERQLLARKRITSLHAPCSETPELLVLEVLTDEETPAPFETAWASGSCALLHVARAHLPEREQQVVTFYYENGLTFKEIGTSLHISEARAYQLHAQAMTRLRDYVEKDREALLCP